MNAPAVPFTIGATQEAMAATGVSAEHPPRATGVHGALE